MRFPHVLLLLLLGACQVGAQPATSVGSAAAPPIVDRQLTELSILARAEPPSQDELRQWGSAPRTPEKLASYIDHLLESPKFSHVIAPEVFLGEILAHPPIHAVRFTYVLKTSAASDGPTVYYLERPCKQAEAVAVKPWWNLAASVLVCTDAYRPDVWMAQTAGKSEMSCDSTEASPVVNHTSGCGCGPNLIRCIRGSEDSRERRRAAHAELRDTVAYIVEHDLPFATMYSGRYTFHDRTMELVYRMWRTEAEKRGDGAYLADLDTWPVDGKWSERYEPRDGAHAGLLTAPGLLHYLADLRQRQWNIFERMWCTGASSVGAMPEDLLHLGVASFQGGKNEGWKRLAAMPICTDCHARMDYGFQFFEAYPDPKPIAGHFVPERARNGQKGMLYGRDINDPRGEAELTPEGFAEIAERQPEFGRCMAQDVADQVFGSEAAPADLKALSDGFDARHTTVKQLFKAALLRYAAHSSSGEPVLASEVTPPYSGTGPVPLSHRLIAQVETLCSDCHFDGAVRKPSFEGTAIARPLLVDMLDQVATGRMPKDRPLDAAQRLELVDLLAAHLWPSHDDRAEAHRDFGGTAVAPAAWRWSVAQGLIAHTAGEPDSSVKPWDAIENGVRGDQAAYTPDYAVMSAIEAYNQCKASTAGKDKTKLVDCVRSATRPDLFLRNP